MLLFHLHLSYGAVRITYATWSLIIKYSNVGAGFPRPGASITDAGGENPPLRCCYIYYSNTNMAYAILHIVIRSGSRSLHRPPFSAGQERSIAEHRNSDGSSSAVAICLWMRWSYERDLSSARADSFRRPL